MRFGIRPHIRRAFRLALRRPDLSEREIEEELRTHVALRTAHLVARGLTPTEAERQAVRRSAPVPARSRCSVCSSTATTSACSGPIRR